MCRSITLAPITLARFITHKKGEKKTTMIFVTLCTPHTHTHTHTNLEHSL